MVKVWKVVKQQHKLDEFGNQRTINVVGARENVGSPVVQQSGIQCFKCKEFGHYAKECRKPKRVKDSAYHKEKMLLCKQVEKGVPLQAEQYDWLTNMDEEIDEQELEAHYSYMAKIQENDQDDVESDDEHVALANLKLDVDENKKIQKKLKKANTTLAQELKECKTILAETSKTLRESNSVWDNIIDNAWVKHTKDQFYAPTAQDINIQIKTCLMPLALKTQNDSFIFVHELKQETHVDLKYVESLEKEIDEHESDKAEFINTISLMSKEVHKKTSALSLISLMGVSVWEGAEAVHLQAEEIKLEYSWNIVTDSRVTPSWREIVSLAITSNVNAVCATCGKCLVDSDHFACVTKMLNDMNARTKKPIVVPISTRKPKGHANKSFAPILGYEDLVQRNITINKGNDLLTDNRGSDLHTISLQESTSSNPLCLMAKALPTQAWLWHRRLSHLNFDYINLLLKKDIVIGLPKLKYVKDQLCYSCKVSKAKRNSFKLKAVPNKMKEKGNPCILVGYSTQSKGYHVYNKRTRLIVESIHIRFDEIKEMSETYVANDTLGLVPQQQKTSDYDNCDPVPQLQNVSSSADAHVPSQQELDLLFGPLYDEFFTTDTSSVNKSSSPTNNSNQQDTQPTTNIQPTLEPSTPTYVHAEENNDNQAE
uniref:Gag-Pol polyprotein n=1 Tax=Tanacetum cinerariifolium TaxID=118510 RepID=A0A699GUW3_TANCI|nr:Gag-Pol polyprotein [Tanacetum cinerariifolium]